MELQDSASIERAVLGCEYVVHVAGPYPNRPAKDESVFLRPGVDGCITVLKASQKAKVKRVVVTCAMASVCMKNEKNHKSLYDENDWSDPENVLNIHHKITY